MHTIRNNNKQRVIWKKFHQMRSGLSGIGIAAPECRNEIVFV